MKYPLFTLFAALLSGVAAAAPEATARQEPSGEYVAEGEVDASPDQVARVLWDVESYPQFMPTVKEARVITTESGDHKIDYIVYDTKLPFAKDRDAVNETRMERGPDVIRITFRTAPAGTGPAPSSDRVRLAQQEGSWELRGLDGGKRTKITFRQRVDPGGNLTGSAEASSFVTSNMKKSIAAVGERAKPIAP